MTDAATRARLGVSACLLGQKVRFDAGHKHDRYVTETLGEQFELVPFCPEVAAGLGTPRPTIRLVGDPASPRAVGVRDGRVDVTDALTEVSARHVEHCLDLCGYILKRGSPSCGMERVKVYDRDHGMPIATGPGIFAARLRARLPLLPVEEEGRLRDPLLRENFITRVYALHRWQALLRDGVSRGRLMAFHASHKYLLLAHDEIETRRLGRLLAESGSRLEALLDEYLAGFMGALARLASRKRHANVLERLTGHLRPHLDAGDRAELLETVARYRNGEVPLIVPMTLLTHHFRRQPDPYVAGQHYLEPYPAVLMLRNAI